MTRVIDSMRAIEAAHAEAKALLNAGDAAGAIALADDCVAAPGHDTNVMQLQAAMCTDGGHTLGHRDLIERGAALWQRLRPESNPATAYNLANAEMAIYEVGVADDDLGAGWERDREHLHTARRMYDRIGEDPAAPRELRLQALTNAGNAYDIVGRDLDALTRYDRALALDPEFGMALGNKGIALYHFAPFMRQHAPTVLHQAALALDQAITHGDSVNRFGGPGALRRFEEVRGKMPALTAAAPGRRRRGRWADAHLDWCLREDLFLHVSHDCLREDTPALDPLFFRSVVTGLDDAGQQRIRELVDAFNAVKQEYVAARYIAWLASDRRSPIREQATAVAERVSFLDSLQYARWGIRTGMATQALAAATNVLDKVASFVPLYLVTARRARGVSFAALWRHGSTKAMDPEFSAALARPERNVGLLALCDLSCDVAATTPLSRRFGLRHTATHRFLVAHTEKVPASNEWFDRLRWPDLLRETVSQLRVARAALVYLARTIDAHEGALRRGTSATTTAVIPPMPIPPVHPRLVEYE